jgi:hypothetical protein
MMLWVVMSCSSLRATFFCCFLDMSFQNAGLLQNEWYYNLKDCNLLNYSNCFYTNEITCIILTNLFLKSLMTHEIKKIHVHELLQPQSQQINVGVLEG